MRRAGPRPIAEALPGVVERAAPATLLAEVQRRWPAVAGEAVARVTRPEAERGGVVTVGCESAVWAHELELLAPALLERLNAELGDRGVSRLRFRSDGRSAGA